MDNIADIGAISSLARYTFILKIRVRAVENTRGSERWPFWIFERTASWQNTPGHFQSQVEGTYSAGAEYIAGGITRISMPNAFYVLREIERSNEITFCRVHK